MTKIEWTHRPGTKGESWNLIGGCTKVSPACDNCYALSMSWRIQNMAKRPERYEGVVRTESGLQDTDGKFRVRHHWTGRINLDYAELMRPYRWRKPRTVFVQSMGDLFHEKVPDEFIRSAFETMVNASDHTYIVLTKRARRMKQVMTWLDQWMPVESRPHIWLGVTAENQEQADRRITWLLQTPAAVRWVSVEPMLSGIQMPGLAVPGWNIANRPMDERLDWVVIGGESGPNIRPMKAEWALDLIEQCDDHTAVFVKQINKTASLNRWTVSKDPSEWRPELRRREWPR